MNSFFISKDVLFFFSFNNTWNCCKMSNILLRIRLMEFFNVSSYLCQIVLLMIPKIFIFMDLNQKMSLLNAYDC